MGGAESRRGTSPNRRWCIPPAILREADEPFEGWHVLSETDGPLGIRLWVALRDVTLRAAAPAQERGKLFADGAAVRRLDAIAGAAVEPELEVPLVALAAVAGDPSAVPEQAVALVCLRISAWAEARGSAGTAVAFAQAAALTRPADPDAACRVGRLAAAWGRTERGETWLRRAIGVARRAGDGKAYAVAQVELGSLLARRGLHRAARGHLVGAMRAARRGGHPRARAAALHGLFRLALHTGDLDEAARLSSLAAKAAHRTRTGISAVMLDVAALHLASGHADRATRVLLRVTRPPTRGADRVAALALLAVAAALQEDAGEYQAAWSTAWPEAADAPAVHAGALLNLARAATIRGDWLWADQALRRAAGHVTGRAEAQTADALAKAIAASRGPSAPRAGT